MIGSKRLSDLTASISHQDHARDRRTRCQSSHSLLGGCVNSFDISPWMSA
jgi:hypothetical protein